MPIFRFDKTLRVTRGVKAFLTFEGGVTRVVTPDAARNGERKKNRRRTRRLKNEFKSERAELRRITEDVRASRRGAGAEEQIEHVKRAKRKQQEIFRLKNELHTAEGAPGTGALPDFVIIGAPKCGTTFFYHLLTKHPHVEAAANKEPHFFDLLFDEGVEWYRQCFVPPRWKDGHKTVTGEGTPSYLFHPHAAERMAEVVPRARLMVLLRNPVDRAYSAYYHQVRNGGETRTFEEAIEASLAGPRRGQLSQGVYVDHLVRWSRFFGDEQMLVLKSEDFFEYPREVLERVLDFLDLPEWNPEDSELRLKRNKGDYVEKMNPTTRRRLEEYFEPHNRRLYEYLGADFGW